MLGHRLQCPWMAVIDIAQQDSIIGTDASGSRETFQRVTTVGTELSADSVCQVMRTAHLNVLQSISINNAPISIRVLFNGLATVDWVKLDIPFLCTVVELFRIRIAVF